MRLGHVCFVWRFCGGSDLSESVFLWLLWLWMSQEDVHEDALTPATLPHDESTASLLHNQQEAQQSQDIEGAQSEPPVSKSTESSEITIVVTHSQVNFTICMQVKGFLHGYVFAIGKYWTESTAEWSLVGIWIPPHFHVHLLRNDVSRDFLCFHRTGSSESIDLCSLCQLFSFLGGAHIGNWVDRSNRLFGWLPASKTWRNCSGSS